MITSKHDAMHYFYKKGKKVCLKCSLVDGGVEWIGCGETVQEALKNLNTNIINFTNNYPKTYDNDC